MASAEDQLVVRTILGHGTNYYRILGVDQGANEATIKVAFKKLALKCHPDKNKDARAAEAFKMLNMANSVLCDPEKRRTFDHHGAEGVQRQESTGNPNAARRRHVDADDFADFFPFPFGGRPPARGHHQHHQGGGPHVHELNGNMIMLLPLLLFFLLILLMQGGSSLVDNQSRGQQVNIRSLFSLHSKRDEGFVVKRDTIYLSDRGLKTTYYVKGNFGETLRRYGINLGVMEHEVLRAQRDYLSRRCESEIRKRSDDPEANRPYVCQQYEVFQRYVG
jgi:hypothetical protein